MKTSVLTMVMMVLVSMNINAKTNNDSWRNSNKKGNTTVVVVKDSRNHGEVGHRMDKRMMDKRFDRMHRHHECVLVKDGKKTSVCKICDTRYNEKRHRK